jgi:hypothetical protein
LKPPAPGLFETGPEQQVIVSYPFSLAAAAILFVLVFSAFAVGRTMTPVKPPDTPPPPSRKDLPSPPASERDAVRIHIPPTRPVPTPPAPVPAPPAPAKPRWTIRLLEYDVTAPNALDEMRRSHIEPAQKRLRDAYNAESRSIEWTRGSRKYVGLFYGRWDSADHPDIEPLVQKLRDLEPFNKGRKPFANCKSMLEPAPE